MRLSFIDSGKYYIKLAFFYTFLAIIFSAKLLGIEINRVIVATNNNPTYIEFWPVVAPLWEQMGFRPTLALIADESCSVDTSIGDVIRFKPIPGVSEALQAQCVRLLLPILYPNDGCIISDIDMLPISRTYFVEGAKKCPDNAFLVYRDKAWPEGSKRFPMCYFTAKGAIFSSIFGISKQEEISPLIEEWSKLGFGWDTDEKVLYKYTTNWEASGNQLILLGKGVERRLDRITWDAQMKTLSIKDYIDSHCPRPYSAYRDSIDRVVKSINLFLKSEKLKEITPEGVYSLFDDIKHPSVDDYRFLQTYLTREKGGIIKPLDDPYVDENLKGLKIVSPEGKIESGIIAVNCDLNTKENCLIVYSTFNKNYAQGLKRLVQHVANSDFVGHIIYHMGGWPNVEAGDLVLAHIPYAFKVCSFREAQRLGYKRAFWLDSPAVPKIKLNDIFKIISEKGYYVMGNQHNVGPYFSPKAAAYFGITMEEANAIPSCSAGMFGVDFTNEKISPIIDMLYQAAISSDGFQSKRPEQNALSIILHKQKLNEFVPHKEMLVLFDWLR